MYTVCSVILGHFLILKRTPCIFLHIRICRNIEYTDVSPVNFQLLLTIELTFSDVLSGWSKGAFPPPQDLKKI